MCRFGGVHTGTSSQRKWAIGSSSEEVTEFDYSVDYHSAVL
jgi:hypothetical protein